MTTASNENRNKSKTETKTETKSKTIPETKPEHQGSEIKAALMSRDNAERVHKCGNYAGLTLCGRGSHRRRPK